jgi:hypothetical protein
LSYYAYVFSSTKLEISAEQDLPGSEGAKGERMGVGDGGRNNPNNICTYESMNLKNHQKYIYQ